MISDAVCNREGKPHRHGDAVQQLRDEVVIESRSLLAGRKEIQIRHEGQLYRLRLTKNDKLILNK